MAVRRLDARIAASDTDGGSTADSRSACGHQRRLANGCEQRAAGASGAEVKHGMK